MNRFKLTETSQRLKQRYGRTVGYSKIYRAVIDGDLDAERDASGRFWTLNEDQLPIVAALFGLETQAEHGRPQNVVA